MYSDTGNTTSLVLGFPIRTSSDPRSVGSSPRHIAASHVLHRPLMPRHPPCALKHLQHKNQLLKIEITPQQTNTAPSPQRRTETHASLMLATTIHESNTTPHHQAGQQHATHDQRREPTNPQGARWKDTTTPTPTKRAPDDDGPVVSKPNSVFGNPPTPTPTPTKRGRAPRRSSCLPVHQTPTHYRRKAIQRIAQNTEPPRTWAGLSLVVLLRKEVIQPHLPVRLPCYDFVPIADPTFDGSLPYGLGHRLRVLPTFMT